MREGLMILNNFHSQVVHDVLELFEVDLSVAVLVGLAHHDHQLVV